MDVLNCKICKVKPDLVIVLANYDFICPRCRTSTGIKTTRKKALEQWNELMKPEVRTGSIYTTATRRTRVVGQEFNQALTNYVLGLCGEAGEVSDLIKKHIFHQHRLDYRGLIDELGDTLWYIAAIADTIGIDLDYIMEQNIKKIQARYPDGFDPKRSIHREEKNNNDSN